MADHSQTSTKLDRDPENDLLSIQKQISVWDIEKPDSWVEVQPSIDASLSKMGSISKINIILRCFSDNDLIWGVETQRNEFGDILLEALIKSISERGFNFQYCIISYFDLQEQMFVFCGKWGALESIAIPKEAVDPKSKRLTIKYQSALKPPPLFKPTGSPQSVEVKTESPVHNEDSF